MLDETDFEPNEEPEVEIDPETGEPKKTPDEAQFDAEKNENIAANQDMKNRRSNLKPWIERIKRGLQEILGEFPEPSSIYVAFEVLYERVYEGLDASMNKTSQEANEWMRLAKTIIELDEYAIMESLDGLMYSSEYPQLKKIVEGKYDSLVKSARSYQDVCKFYLEIGFALVELVEDAINNNPDDAEDYIELKDQLDSKYGPLFKGMEGQLGDLTSRDRRYGRSTFR